MSKAVLIVLDGFGIGKDSPFNAIRNAKMPFYQELWTKYPHSELWTHGKAVGLPPNVMGNSEVGHMTMGAGRIIYQDLTRISNSIENKDFFKNTVLLQAMNAQAPDGILHLMGLLSDGGVHSHIDHLKALLDLALEQKIPRVAIHLFLDGRDTPPDSAPKYVQSLFEHIALSNPSSVPCTEVRVASIQGRYYAMDRDQRWDRVEKGYRALCGHSPENDIQGGINPSAETNHKDDPLKRILRFIEKSYADSKSDEFLVPVSLDPSWCMKTGDSIIFFNYRSDRAREISAAISDPEFCSFQKVMSLTPAFFVGMTQYDQKLTHAKVAFPPQSTDQIFGKCLEVAKLAQCRIAETEKYAHVTFFFNAGREKPFSGESRLLIPSPREVETYDLKPEMSAFEIAEQASLRLKNEQDAFTLINFANADMVGHTGNYEATVRAMEALDQCLSQVIGAAHQNNAHVLVTADHGNAEEMRDCRGKIHTQHTLNPVPALWIAPNTAQAPKSERKALLDGGLADIMPTLCTLIGIPIPAEVTGKCLIPK